MAQLDLIGSTIKTGSLDLARCIASTIGSKVWLSSGWPVQQATGMDKMHVVVTKGPSENRAKQIESPSLLVLPLADVSILALRSRS